MQRHVLNYCNQLNSDISLRQLVEFASGNLPWWKPFVYLAETTSFQSHQLKQTIFYCLPICCLCRWMSAVFQVKKARCKEALLFSINQWFSNFFWSRAVCGSCTVRTYHLVLEKFNLPNIIRSKVCKNQNWHNFEINKMSWRICGHFWSQQVHEIQ